MPSARRSATVLTRDEGSAGGAIPHSLVVVSPPPRAFDRAVPLLRDQPLLAHSGARFRRLAYLGRFGGSLDEHQKPGVGSLTILRLGSVRSADKYQLAFGRHMLTGEREQPLLDIGW